MSFSQRLRITERKFWLGQRYYSPYCFIHINKCGGTSVERALGIPKVHDTAQQRKAIVGQKRWDKMYCFSVIRHPFPKVVSHYNYRIKTNQTDLKTHPVDLNTWISLSYGEHDSKYYDQPLMFAPCFDWLTDENGKIIVDDIFKLETLNQNWDTICERARISLRSLGHKNRTSQSSLNRANELLNEHSKTIIRRIFKSDFDNFYLDEVPSNT